MVPIDCGYPFDGTGRDQVFQAHIARETAKGPLCDHLHLRQVLENQLFALKLAGIFDGSVVDDRDIYRQTNSRVYWYQLLRFLGFFMATGQLTVD